MARVARGAFAHRFRRQLHVKPDAVAARAEGGGRDRDLVAGRDFAGGIGQPDGPLELIVHKDVDDRLVIETSAVGEIERKQNVALGPEANVRRQIKGNFGLAVFLAENGGVDQPELLQRELGIGPQRLFPRHEIALRNLVR
jgi:hypothetical protein